MEFPLSFVVVGSGFRSLFYARIAKRFPQFFKIPALQDRGKGAEIECRVWNPDYHIAGALHGSKAGFCGGGSEPEFGLERGQRMDKSRLSSAS